MLHQQSNFDFVDDEFNTLRNGCWRHLTHLRKKFKFNSDSNSYSPSEFDEAWYSGFGSLHIQYFLAKLCDYQIDDDDDDDRNLDTNTFIRHPRTPFAPEINRLCRQFFSGIWLNPDDYDVKIIITILKEYLFQIEGGVFGLLTKEFFEISLESPLDMTLIYLHRMLMIVILLFILNSASGKHIVTTEINADAPNAIGSEFVEPQISRDNPTNYLQTEYHLIIIKQYSSLLLDAGLVFYVSCFCIQVTQNLFTIGSRNKNRDVDFSIVHELPYSVQQSVYLLCKSVQNLLRLAGGPTSAAFTDLLMNLTPCLFADSWNDTKFFLRCNRLLLIMIQNRPQVFLPLPFLDECGDIQWLNDEIKFAEKIFLIGFFDKVHRLENQLSAAESVDSGIGLDEDRSLATNLIEKSTTKKCIDQNLSTPDLYRLTFSIDLEE